MEFGIKSLFVFLSLLVHAGFAFKESDLVKPIVEKCKNRPKEYNINGRNYFYSNNYNETFGLEVSWEEARNYCREYCMDTISINTQQEWDLVVQIFRDELVDYIWTSGYACDKGGCLKDVKFRPRNINGFYWTLDNTKIPPTNIIASGWKNNPWSTTGHIKLPQPDNAELAITGISESCVAILHNVYDDGIKMHDVACYHKKHFICEDAPDLLQIVRVD